MTPETRRILTFAAITAALMFAFSWVQMKYAPPKPKPRAAPSAEAPAASAESAAPASAVAPVDATAVREGPEKTVTLETPELRATFSTVGGALKSLELKGDKFRDPKSGAPVDLVKAAPGVALPGALVASPELGGAGGLAGDPAARGAMRIAAQDAKSVTFEGPVGAAQVRKTWTVGEGPYGVGLEVTATVPRKGELFLLYPGFLPPNAPKGGFLSGGEVFETITPLCRASGKTSRYNGKAEKEPVPGAPAWVGLDEHYFVGAILPAKEAGECLFFRGPRAGEQGVALSLPVEGTVTAAFKLFQGPKQLDLLRSIGRGLDTAVDYGTITNLFAFFARILLAVMRALHGVVANWGLAIILLTVLVKAILYPLTAKSMQSMNEMRKLQPEVEKLKAKYGGDKEKMNLAVMQLYQQHKVNPLGGCLPMLIQMPIWFALYATLQTSVELYHEHFLWLADLTRFDPYYILPLAMGGSSFLMQKLSPQPADNAQAKMLLYFMPVFFTFIMLKLPAGLTLYILVNNLLSIAQQQWLMRRSSAPVPAKA